MLCERSPADKRFFVVDLFDPADYRMSPVGVIGELRVNIILFLQPNLFLAFMFSKGDTKSFLAADEEIPEVIQLKTPVGIWQPHSIPTSDLPRIRQLAGRAVSRMTGA